ncbi:uncharacterized protein Z520_07141 [Fonsecaea multimorphosa CBS 102226]|uniref:AB hydrolase-1 domain-containing protein n=1 Tax=Fonsecaea multimorphosa CBS 102226 TaxID=1442371 RepID=A0A0D2JU57_9EURO|nr:uncharacterized protein Z520_07141 [Fonsecaea multimorphosa CBS 102226]KIX97027.1 hypothetical protein Z520_07141 [Fonsecaea multimorphosa CBS 102226]OAL22806.1 hypothetical protein AYO22_06714 [Fonsecaea multimorphosa]
MSSKPSLVFVPGAWHRAETWGKIATILETQHQYKCRLVTLPSTLSDPAATLLDDIEAVRAAIVAETSQGHDVVVVMHSYGGIPGQSAIKGLTLPKGKPDAPSPPTPSAESRRRGHVIGLIVIASGFVIPAKSFLDGMGGQPPPSWKLDYESGFAEIVADARELFYHDLPEEEGKEWVNKLTKQSLKTLTEGGEHTYPGWMDVPSWYLATKDDKALPVEAQRMFVQMAKDAGASVTLREVESSHSPMLSRPEETVQVVLDATASFCG